MLSIIGSYRLWFRVMVVTGLWALFIFPQPDGAAGDFPYLGAVYRAIGGGQVKQAFGAAGIACISYFLYFVFKSKVKALNLGKRRTHLYALVIGVALLAKGGVFDLAVYCTEHRVVGSLIGSVVGLAVASLALAYIGQRPPGNHGGQFDGTFNTGGNS